MLIAQKKGPTHRWNGGNSTPNVWQIPKIIPTEKQHPTEKPVDLMRKCILIHSNEGDTVLEPFAGQGSTIIACLTEKRNYIAFELDKDFYKNAIQKIEIHKQQLRLF